ncbi:uncharacterized protein LOC141994519 [Natator depressus]|uniref:uncharacterized protein LOC141994519 n=1 Tax=Natator depressus TaxID=27790 RepID=UPI003EBF532E
MEPVTLSCSSSPGQAWSKLERVKMLKRKRKETIEKKNSQVSVTDGWMKPAGICSPSDKAVVGATRTPPREPPKNQESALRPLSTQNSTRVQMKHQPSPNLIYVKPKDKTKHSGKKHPCKDNSSSSAATATPSPEKTVSENAHIHKPGTGALGIVNKKPRIENTCDAKVLQPCKHNSSSSVATAAPSPEKTVSENVHIHKPGVGTLGALNVCRNTHIHKPRAGTLGVVNKKLRTDKDPPYSSIWEEFDASFRKLMDAVSSGSLKLRHSKKIWKKYDALFRKLMDAESSGGLKERGAGKGGSDQA